MCISFCHVHVDVFVLQEDNRTKVAHVFTPVIIRNKMLTPHQASQLVMFMVDHADNLWEAPDEVEEAVRKSLLELQEGKESQMAGV